jgi:molybdopterin-guanine dinucleotide biosynthesis protein A
MKASGIILAGGKNTRIKTEKAFIELRAGSTLIEDTLKVFQNIFSEIIIVTNNPQAFLKFGTRVVEDLVKDKAALGGIFSGLCYSQSELNFVVGCDMPFHNSDLINYIIQKPVEYDLVIPVINNKAETLFARYSKNALPVICSHLLKDKLKLQNLLSDLKALKINSKEIERFDPEHLSFFNINTQEDLKKAKDICSKHT